MRQLMLTAENLECHLFDVAVLLQVSLEDLPEASLAQDLRHHLDVGLRDADDVVIQLRVHPLAVAPSLSAKITTSSYLHVCTHP